MPITIMKKLPVPIGADPAALNKLGYCKVLGTISPLSPGDDAANDALIAEYKKARKFEAKLRAKCQKAAKKNL